MKRRKWRTKHKRGREKRSRLAIERGREIQMMMIRFQRNQRERALTPKITQVPKSAIFVPHTLMNVKLFGRAPPAYSLAYVIYIQ